MAKKKVKSTKKTVKKGWSPMRILELLVLIGSAAAVVLRVFQVKKSK